jgi:hypothetical protein
MSCQSRDLSHSRCGRNAKKVKQSWRKRAEEVQLQLIGVVENSDLSPETRQLNLFCIRRESSTVSTRTERKTRTSPIVEYPELNVRTLAFLSLESSPNAPCVGCVLQGTKLGMHWWTRKLIC